MDELVDGEGRSDCAVGGNLFLLRTVLGVVELAVSLHLEEEFVLGSLDFGGVSLTMGTAHGLCNS